MFLQSVRLAALWLLWAAAAPGQVAILQIRVIEGEGAVHLPGARSSRPIAVEITDETGRPVAGAAVSFHLPEDGPGGAFVNGLRTEVVITDAARTRRTAGTGGQPHSGTVPDSDSGIEGAGPRRHGFVPVCRRTKGWGSGHAHSSRFGTQEMDGGGRRSGRRSGGRTPGHAGERGESGGRDSERAGAGLVQRRNADDYGGQAMKSPAWACLAAVFFLAPAAQAQFDLFLVEGTVERPAPAVYDFGVLYANESVTAHFRLRNTSGAAATLNSLAVAGAGFTLTAPTLPVGLAPQQAIDLSVAFRTADTGAYSASLHSEGAGILLIATVAPRLTYRVDSGTGVEFPGTLDFGSVVRGGIRRAPNRLPERYSGRIDCACDLRAGRRLRA